MVFKDVFINRFAEIRVGWRLLLFVAMLLILRWGIMETLKAIGFRNEFAGLSLILAATLAVSYVLTRFVNKKPFGAIGLSLHPRMFREFGMGCLLGFLMMTGIFLIEFTSGFVQLSWKGASVLNVVLTVGWSLMFFAVAAFLEEALYRGYFFQTLMQWTTFLPAMLLMSVFFAVGHLRNPNATTFGLVNVGLAGVWLSIAYMKTRSLWLPFGLHASWNFSQTGLYSFPTSGLSFHDLRLFDRTQSGPEWITGGSFGPEGGMLATVALIVCTWYILKSRYLQTPEGIVTLDSVEDLLPKPDVARAVRMRRWYLLFFVLAPICVTAQPLSDEEFETRVKKGIGYIYNLEFEAADREFMDLVRVRPRDPAGHFFLAMVNWWRILIDIDNKQYDDQLIDSLDVVIDLCDEMLDRNENDVIAMFFKGGAIGFQGRLKFHRDDYLGAAAAGKKALPLVQDASSADPKNYDIFLGTGIYNYYAEVIPDQYPWTKPLLLFLPSGDRQKGIRQLTACAEKGKYASIECTYFLLQIYYSYEKDFQKALVLALSLNSRFPDNPLFHRYVGRCYVSTNNWVMVQSVFGEIAARGQKRQRGYSPSTLREAEYYLGLCDMNSKQYDAALKHLYKCDELSRSLDTEEISGFMVMTNLKIGMAYDALARRDLAEKQYRKVLDMKEYLDSHKQAEDYLRIPFTMR